MQQNERTKVTTALASGILELADSNRELQLALVRLKIPHQHASGEASTPEKSGNPAKARA